MENIITHWLEHEDSELAQIYSKNEINGIIELGEKRVADFFRHLKVLTKIFQTKSNQFFSFKFC